MQILGDAPQQLALTPAEILKKYPEAIDQIMKACVDPQFEFERTIQINKARRNWQFVKGNHFLIPGLVNTPYGEIADYLMMDAPTIAEETGADIKLCHSINVIGGDMYKFVAVLGNSAPRVKALADDPQDPQQVEQAKMADAELRDLWVKWKAEQIQRTLAFHQYVTGPSYLRTVWVVDRQKYGQTVEPTVSTQPSADGIPLPAMGEPKIYANGDCELHVYSVLEISHPYMAKDLSSTECPWLKCEVMRSKWELLTAYASDDPENPNPLEEYRVGDPPDDVYGASSAAANEAREAVANPSSLGRPRKPDFWRHVEYWAYPQQFEAVTDSSARQIIKQTFSNGMYIASVGSKKIKIDNRAMTADFAVCKTGRGEKICEDPISSDVVPLQRALNDLLNMALETVLRAITQTIVDAPLLDRESLAKKEALPAEIILTAIPVDGDLQKRIYQIPPARLSDQVIPLWTQIRAVMQDISGIRPELSGGGVPTQTYREAKQRKDQALMQLSPQAQELQAAWETAGANGVRMRAKYGSGTINVPRKGSFGQESDIVDHAMVAETGWHTEADDNFPMSGADKFDKLWALLKEFPPEVQQALSILDPINLEQTLEILQIPDFQSVAEEQKQKTLADIRQLLQGTPIQQPDGSSQPSIPMDPYDDHAFVASFVPKWLIANQRDRQSNAQGFDNIVAWWTLHQQAAQAAAQPPAPPPPPAVKATLGLSAKLEDFPALIPEVFQGAGLPAPPPESATPQVPQGAPSTDQGPGGAPTAPTGGNVTESPLPPLAGIPESPQPPLPIQ